jgi:Flp pilus assembly protein CpaB
MSTKITLVALVCSVGLWGNVAAQNNQISRAQIKTTPTNLSSGNFNKVVNSPNLHAVNIILRKQMRQIPKDLKVGKITKTQAQNAWKNLMNTRMQELEFFKQNGQKEITVEQKDQLTKTLNQNSGSI